MQTFKVGDLVEVVGKRSTDDQKYHGQYIIIGELASTIGRKDNFDYINKYICPTTGNILRYGGGIWLESVRLRDKAVMANYEIY